MGLTMDDDTTPISALTRRWLCVCIVHCHGICRWCAHLWALVKYDIAFQPFFTILEFSKCLHIRVELVLQRLLQLGWIGVNLDFDRNENCCRFISFALHFLLSELEFHRMRISKKKFCYTVGISVMPSKIQHNASHREVKSHRNRRIEHFGSEVKKLLRSVLLLVTLHAREVQTEQFRSRTE